jgi:hypothetical protein
VADPLVISIPHRLGEDEVLPQVKKALGKASQLFPVLKVEQEVWSGDRLTSAVRALGPVAAQMAANDHVERVAQSDANRGCERSGRRRIGDKCGDESAGQTRWPCNSTMASGSWSVATLGWRSNLSTPLSMRGAHDEVHHLIRSLQDAPYSEAMPTPIARAPGRRA